MRGLDVGRSELLIIILLESTAIDSSTPIQVTVDNAIVIQAMHAQHVRELCSCCVSTGCMLLCITGPSFSQKWTCLKLGTYRHRKLELP